MDGARFGAGTVADVDVAAADAGTLVGPVTAARDRLGLPPAPVAVGHRVVHGLDLRAPAEIDGAVRATIERAAGFAPLHNPPALRMIDAAAALWPGARQVACFDTAFHADNSPEAATLPIPAALREKGLRRYGFHGLSYASVMRRFAVETGKQPPRRLLIAHLGAGASMAAVRDGTGVATTMGFSPMDGLVMATRAGAMDPGVIFHLIREGVAPAAVERMLNRESGLKALGGAAEMKALLARDDADAAFAVSHYVHWARRHAGAMIAAMEGADGMVFTGGIGENAAPVRDRIVAGLGWAGIGAENTWVVPADEEGEIVHAIRSLLGSNPPGV
jgi:acetate kinase